MLMTFFDRQKLGKRSGWRQLPGVRSYSETPVARFGARWQRATTDVAHFLKRGEGMIRFRITKP